MRQRSVILAGPFPLATLPQVFPRAMVHAAIAAEAAGERRRRSLPAPLVVYLNLALAALPDHGSEEVLAELLAALPARTRAGWRRASSTSITAARRRLGPAVMHRLFTQVAAPATPAMTEAAITVPVPASADNRAAFTPATPARPHLHVAALVCPTGALHTATWTPCPGTPALAGDAEPLDLLPGAPVLRSRHAEGVIAEVWSALCLHQAAMALGLSPCRGGPEPRRA